MLSVNALQSPDVVTDWERSRRRLVWTVRRRTLLHVPNMQECVAFILVFRYTWRHSSPSARDPMVVGSHPAPAASSATSVGRSVPQSHVNCQIAAE